MTDDSNVLPFRGRKPLEARPGLPDHPLPWRYGSGFIWDANGQLVGSTIGQPTAEWIARSVNGAHGYETPPEMSHPL